MIPLGRPSIDSSDIEAVVRALESRQLSQAAEVRAFEEELAEVIGVRHVVTVNSGTTALYVSLRALGVGPGDLALVSSYSWIATANVVELCGANCAFVDVRPDSFAMDPDHLEATIAKLAATGQLERVKAILPVHPFGYIADMERIGEIAAGYSIPVVEDAACALGARLGPRSAGALGDIGCFSFHPLKVITTGEGGAVATDSPEVASFIRSFRDHGRTWVEGPVSFAHPGANFRMTEMQAALGRSQLRRIEHLLDARRDALEWYRQELEGLPLALQSYERSRTTGQAMVLRLDPSLPRDDVLAQLSRDGVQAGAGTLAMPFTTYFEAKYGSDPHALPNTYQLGRSALSLPLHPEMTRADQRRVVDSLARALQPMPTGVRP